MFSNRRQRLIATDNVTLMKLATRFAVFMALSLVAIKAAAWVLTGSLSVLSSLVDSVMDATTSLVNFLALRYALRPPDDKHRFGFGKAEPVASLFQAALIGASAAYIAVEAVLRLRNPVPLQSETVGMAVMGVSLVASLALVGFQRFVIRRTESLVVRTDSLHYLTDVLSNGAVLLSLALSYYGVAAADAALALVIAGFVGFSAAGIGREAFGHLVDRELPEAERERIVQIIRAHGEINGVNGLKTRKAGRVRFIQFNLELDGGLPLSTAHRITHAIEAQLLDAFPGAEIIIHQDVLPD